MRYPCCLRIPRINFWMPEPISMKLGMCIMTSEPISIAFFIYLFHQSVCLYMYRTHCWQAGSVECIPPFVARQRVGKRARVFVVASFLGKISVNKFRLQRKTVGRVGFCAVRVVSKKSRRLVLHRTSCFTIDSEHVTLVGCYIEALHHSHVYNWFLYNTSCLRFYNFHT
jgi:hypothetical protein